MKLQCVALTCILCLPVSSQARDFFLTIGGGYAPSGNQASLEKNVLLFQRVLRDQGAGQQNSDVYFADGSAPGLDLEVLDRNAVPKANRLMAEFFGSSRNLGLSYRNHRVPNVSGSTSPRNIQQWFRTRGSKMRSGDRLVIYVTAHGSASGDRQKPHNTTIATWNNSSITVTEFVRMLDGLPQGVEVAAVMVQCHSGGFARFIFEGADPKKGLAKQKRVGFFATVHDRNAAGCTPEVDEASYVEYSTYFWAALSGKDRLGKKIKRPDYNADGIVSFDEAHAYTVFTADTIDLPIKTSGEFLTVHGRYGKKGSELLPDDAAYETVLKFATPSQKAVLEGLSKQLKLTGSDRIMTAHNQSKINPRSRGKFRSRRSGDSSAVRLRRKIAGDLRKRWPELANVMNPKSIEFITSKKRTFIRAIEGHADYQKYRELADKPTADPQKRRVKYERFLRTVDNVIFAENLKRAKSPERYQEYSRLVKAESASLTKSAQTSK